MSETPQATPAPKGESDRLALRGRPRPVTRLNRRTIAVLVGISVVLVAGAMRWAIVPKRPWVHDPNDEVRNVDRIAHAEGLNALPRDYAAVAPPVLGPPLGELGKPVLRAEREAGLVPTADEEAQRAARLRLQDEADAAAKAQVFFRINPHHEDTPLRDMESPAVAASIPAGSSLNPSQTAGEGERQNGQDHKQAFVDRTVDREIYASGRLQTPRSPYQVMAGTVIPAALVTGINSDLPGEIIASVTQNVYDTVTGQSLLIPQGSRLLGQYDSQIAYGQRRVLMAWTRLIRPDGSSLVLDRLPGADAAGQAGVEDKVDWHWGRIFAGAALSTLLGINAELAAANRDQAAGSVVVATHNSTQDTMNQVGEQITRKNLNIQPTLTVRPGVEITVIVQKDLMLKPWSSPMASAFP